MCLNAGEESIGSIPKTAGLQYISRPFLVNHLIQLTTDGHAAYLDAVEGAFQYDIDYAMLIKLYGQEQPQEARYGP